MSCLLHHGWAHFRSHDIMKTHCRVIQTWKTLGKYQSQSLKAPTLQSMGILMPEVCSQRCLTGNRLCNVKICEAKFVQC